MLGLADATRHRLFNDVLLQDGMCVHLVFTLDNTLLNQALYQLLILAS